jgi:DNA-binding CsgD family transcriptional regulator
VQAIRLFLTVLLWPAALLGLRAQEVPRVRNFSPTDYGGQNQNWSLSESPEGWLYVGNNGGLLECDGARWTKFDLPEGQVVRATAVGPRGEIFCGGFGEFGYWQKGGDGRLFYTSLSQQLASERLGKEEIWHIFLGVDCVFFQSFSIVYKFDYQQVTELKPPGAVMFGAAVGERVWIPVIGQGLCEILPSGKFKFVPGSEILKDEIVQFLVPNGAGGLWAGTTNHGIFEVADGQCRAWPHPRNADFKKQQLNKALALRGGGWAIGTILGGVYVLDANGRLRYHLDRSCGLQNNTVLSLVESRDGNLWVGLDRGIDWVQLHSPLTFFSDQTGRIGTVYSAAQWQGRLYLGTNQGVFSAAFRTREARRTPDFRLVEGTQGQVWQLQVFGSELLVGHNGGTFSIRGDAAHKISDVTGGWCTVRAPSRADCLLQSTYTGLICLKKDAKGAWAFSHRLADFGEPLREICFDSLHKIWWGVHPNRGLWHLEIDSALQRVVRARSFGRAQGLPSDYHLDLTTINAQLYVNTEQHPVRPLRDVPGDYWRFEGQSLGAFPRYKWLAGEAGDYFVLEGDNVWWDTGAPRRDLLPLRLVSRYEQVVALPDSTYLFCLENGYAILDRRSARVANEAASAPAPVLRWAATADGTTFAPAKDWTFAYAQNSLKFVFALPFFERAPRFSWRLDGFSKQWSDWQTSAEKEFTNLPEGRHTFRVRSDLGGVETAISFRILPPWYRSKAAYLAYGLLIISFLWAIERYNRRRLDRQRARLEAEKEREILMLEVENQSRELSNAAFNLIRKNEAMQALKDELLAAPPDSKTALQKIARRIDEHLEGDHDWAVFEESFNRVHDDFFKRLLHDFPELTPGDLRLAAYLKMNLSSKEIAPLLNISIRGVENKRYRLRKKLGLPEDANLAEFIIGF